MDGHDWDRLVLRLAVGDCGTPFLGAGACNPTLPTGEELSEILAKRYSYPFVDRTNLPRVAQCAVTLHDPFAVAQFVVNTLKGKGRPNFTDNVEPHGVLAKLPIPCYLTTSYDSFMFSALEQAGKRTQVVIRRLHADTTLTTDSEFVPSADAPVVYHLRGGWDCRESLVLTEDDSLELLTSLTRIVK